MKKAFSIVFMTLALVLTVSSCDKSKPVESAKALILADIPQRLLNAVASVDADSANYAIQALLYEKVENTLTGSVYGIVDAYDEENKAFHFNLFEGEGENTQPWRGNGGYYVAVKFRELDNDQTFSYAENPVKDAYIMGYTERYWADLEEIIFIKVSFDQPTTTVSFQQFDNEFYGKYE